MRSTPFIESFAEPQSFVRDYLATMNHGPVIIEPRYFIINREPPAPPAPEQPGEELSLDALRELCAGAGYDGGVRFTSEGGFILNPSEN